MSHERRNTKNVSCNGESNICRMCELKEPHTTTQIDTKWWFCDVINQRVKSIGVSDNVNSKSK